LQLLLVDFAADVLSTSSALQKFWLLTIMGGRIGAFAAGRGRADWMNAF